jgi:hypothetical protein
MKHVVLITKYFDDPHDYVSIGASELAAAYSRCGFAVHVFCPLGYHSQTLYEVRGNVEIRRIQSPERAAEMGFANRALGHTYELATRSRCDVIECYDLPCASIAATSLRVAGALRAPVISLHSELASPRLANPAEHLADASIRCVSSSAPQRDSIPLPIPSKKWRGPESQSHSFVLPALLEGDHYKMVSDAYARSGVARGGWMLGVIGNNSAWMHSAQSAAAVPSVAIQHATPLRVGLICTAGCRDDIAARHLLAGGHVCVFSSASPLINRLPIDLQEALVFSEMDSCSLAECMRRIADASELTRKGWLDRCAHAITDGRTVETIVNEHVSLWDRVQSIRQSSTQLNAWKQIQSIAVATNPYAFQVSI